MDYLIVILLIILSGLFSGLTLSLLGLDKNELKRKATLGNKDAKRVYAIRKRGNLLLCTLLLGNVAVNSALAIFLSNITTGVIAGFVSTGLIVIFGEIIPQATFSRYALKVGSKTAWLVKVFIFILFPICFPIAYILDKALGEEMNTIYSKKELMEIIKEHEDSEKSAIDSDEERIIIGALSFSDKKAEEIMTPKSRVYALEINAELDEKTLDQIKQKGFTRIPIYKGSIDKVVGILYAKDLINIEKNTKVKSLYKKEKLFLVSKEEKLDKLLNTFIKHKAHLAIIEEKNKSMKGVITLEDVVEEILKQEIIDESDPV